MLVSKLVKGTVLSCCGGLASSWLALAVVGEVGPVVVDRGVKVSVVPDLFGFRSWGVGVIQ